MGLGKSEEEEEAAVEVTGGAGEYGKPFGDNKSGSNNNDRESCSICLEAVVTDSSGDRAWATLHCGHQFHLDCIGSAFNVKGVMQCPNCRKTEKGQWLYASGYRSLPEFSTDDWVPEEDIYDWSYSEMSFGVRWCPFGSFARFHPSSEEGEFSSNAYHELLGQHAIFAEHTAAVSSGSHPCPYIAYLGPFHHPSSSNSSGSISDGGSFGSHWNGPSAPNDILSSYGFPAMDLHYRSWDHHSPPFSIATSRASSSEHMAVPSTTQRSARSSLDLPRMGSFMHPFFVGHSSSARASSSVASSVSPPYQGSNARNRDRVQALQAYYQQQPGSSPAIRTPIIPGTRRSSSHRGMSQAGSPASSSDLNGFYFVPTVTSGRSFQEAENSLPARFHAWEQDHLPSFSSSQTDRDAVWGAFLQGAGASDPGIRSNSFRQRHGSERMPSSQNRS